jgi:hypothetical protein
MNIREQFDCLVLCADALCQTEVAKGTTLESCVMKRRPPIEGRVLVTNALDLLDAAQNFYSYLSDMPAALIELLPRETREYLGRQRGAELQKLVEKACAQCETCPPLHPDVRRAAIIASLICSERQFIKECLTESK